MSNLSKNSQETFDNQKPLVQSPDVLARRKLYQTVITGKSMTKQSFKNETNINNIMSKYEKTGVIDHLSQHNGSYGDFSNVPSFHEALNMIKHSEHMFQNLPANIRKHFNNDPAEFLEFYDDPDNHDATIEMGLRPQPEPAPEPVIEPVPEPATEPVPEPAP